MNNITWTDSDAGRTFWKFNEATQEWGKLQFFTWDEMKLYVKVKLPKGKSSV